MKISFKTGLVSAALSGALALAPMMSAHADSYGGHNNYGNSYNPSRTYYDSQYMAYGNIPAGSPIPVAELPVNRGVGRGSNKGMLDLNRGYYMTVTTEESTGYIARPDRDHYYGNYPASGYMYRGDGSRTQGTYVR